jgi:hypothetical protein
MAPVAFVETLRGSLTLGEEHCPIEIELLAEAPSRAALLQNGCLSLRGLVRAPRWAPEAAAIGTLRIQPSALDYRLRFEGRDGRALHLFGRKHPSVLSPVRSMTRLPVELRTADAQPIAEGELAFDLGELVPFLFGWIGWLPTSRHARRELDVRRRAVERSAWARRPS